MKHLAEAVTRAESLLARREYEAAHGICLEILRAEPRAADAWFLLGVLAADHANFVRAAELFEKAAALAPADPRPRAHLARALIPLNEQAEALRPAEAAEALGPRDALTRDTLGVAFSHLGLHARAVPFFEAAVAAQPRNASFLFNLAASRQFSGDFEGAETAYAAALARDPGLYRAWSARVTLFRQTPERNHVAELSALIEQSSEDPDRALHVGHALAKSFEDLGDYPAALAWLKRAKAAKRATLDYSPERDAMLFEAAAQTFAPGDAAQGFESDAPIFVVGLPRTGTTLVDRILSSHPDVVSVGELTNFGLLVKRAAGTPSNLVLDAETLEAARDADLRALGRAYVESVAELRAGAARFVDKTPLNVLYAGLILKALPNARVVCLRRHPMDACLANYRQLFATGVSHYDYAYDLADLGRYFVGFDTLVAHWRAVLPPERFMEVAYEDVVADQEGQTRRLLGFCGLDWDPRCLEFHKNAAPVATASSVQVRQPLYASSIGRWRRYGEGLAPLRRVLEAGGVAVD